MHSSNKLKVESRKLDITKSFFLNTFFFILAPILGCGRSVYSLRMGASTSLAFIPSPDFCINFVRRLWVSTVRYPRVIPATYPLIFRRFVSVNSDLCTLPTGLTIRTAFK